MYVVCTSCRQPTIPNNMAVANTKNSVHAREGRYVVFIGFGIFRSQAVFQNIKLVLINIKESTILGVRIQEGGEMMEHHELTDVQWEVLEPCLPPLNTGRGRKMHDRRRISSTVFCGVSKPGHPGGIFRNNTANRDR